MAVTQRKGTGDVPLGFPIMPSNRGADKAITDVAAQKV